MAGNTVIPYNSRIKVARGVRYPWDEWFMKGRFTLVRGKHFGGKVHGMAQTARTAAAVRNIRISVSIGEDRLTITVK